MFEEIREEDSIKFESLLNIIKANLARAQGEIYCFVHRKQKKSAFYARKALQAIVTSSKELRKVLQETKNTLPTKKKEKIPVK